MTAVAVRFAGVLRQADLAADLTAVIGFARALTVIDLGAPDDVRAAGAALFVERPEQRSAYDAVFDRFWLLAAPRDRVEPEVSHGAADASTAQQQRRDRGPATQLESQASHAGNAGELAAADDEMPPGERGPTGSTAIATYSAAEALNVKAFDEMTPAELRDAARLVDHLRPRLARRRTRRYRLHQGGPLLAPRAMMRRSIGTGGDPLAWIWRRRLTRPRPIIAICDISGSMEQHSRFALRFVHALTHAGVRVESFVFGTRLTRITTQLRRRNADEALRDVAETVHDWAGGTQIGAALHVFNRRWARRALRSSAIVLIVSDGWDRGDPAIVANEMRHLRRRCHRLVWLNPLAGTTGYEPRTAGMVAAFPYIDDFVGLRSVESLERLGELLGPAALPKP